MSSADSDEKEDPYIRHSLRYLDRLKDMEEKSSRPLTDAELDDGLAAFTKHYGQIKAALLWNDSQLAERRIGSREEEPPEPISDRSVKETRTWSFVRAVLRWIPRLPGAALTAGAMGLFVLLVPFLAVSDIVKLILRNKRSRHDRGCSEQDGTDGSQSS